MVAAATDVVAAALVLDEDDVVFIKGRKRWLDKCADRDKDDEEEVEADDKGRDGGQFCCCCCCCDDEDKDVQQPSSASPSVNVSLCSRDDCFLGERRILTSTSSLDRERLVRKLLVLLFCNSVLSLWLLLLPPIAMLLVVVFICCGGDEYMLLSIVLIEFRFRFNQSNAMKFRWMTIMLKP